MSSSPDRPSEQRLASVRERLDYEMDRREVLRTLVGAGYTLGLARWLGVDDVFNAADGEVPVVTALVRSNPADPWSLEPQTTNVPAAWYARVRKAFELNDMLAQSTITGYLGSAVVPGSYDSGSARITVEVSVEPTELRETLEKLADGILFNVKSINPDDFSEERPVGEPRYLRNPEQQGVPAGIICESQYSIATLGAPLYDPDSRSHYFSTAQHAFQAAGETVGSPVSLPFENGEQSELGRVVGSYEVADVAIIEPTGYYQPHGVIAGDSTYDVRGQYTRLGLADLVARGEPLHKVGGMTGQTSGTIQGIDAVSCLTSRTCRHGQLRWGTETDMTDGDSGSVSFHRDEQADDGSVLIAGFNNARTWWPGQSYVWGISAYALTDHHGLHF
ncbi:S1 family peptidase [Halobacteria archaeon AArc-curdl1]|uniref:S1 family peptidase n=1 Tax=Natronosalvus hydrolyticus TaxID=2979988 RepID=A0AAP2Z7V1_9EURY|nr:S1 family peptidase [Halobacteria archaeon AArc-curdl1]